MRKKRGRIKKERGRIFFKPRNRRGEGKGLRK